MADVLIIDDDAAMARMLEKMIRNIGHAAECTMTLENGMALALEGAFDVVFLDVHMPDGSGLEALARLRALPDAPEVIIMTGIGDPDGAELAIKNGAWDYIQKPLSPKKILLPIQRVLQYRDNARAISQAPVVLAREGLIGNGPKFEACLRQMALAAHSDATVLITGETGTGKELFARHLHANSRRKEQQLVVVDCGALPENLIESALFGHEKGAFTGADRSKPGLVAMAHQGTLFLDEVGELSMVLQKAFLRVLQEKRFRPVGGRREITSDFRLVAATNQNPEALVEKGLLRKDLLYRLRGISIHLPPLRERREDIDDLVLHYMTTLTRRADMAPKGFAPEFLELLRQHDWQGNVREMVHVLESAISTAGDAPILFPTHLPEQMRVTLARAAIQERPAMPAETIPPPTESRPPAVFSNGLPTFKAYRQQAVSDAEESYLAALMQETEGSIQQACQISGIGRTRLYSLMKKHNIRRKN